MQLSFIELLYISAHPLHKSKDYKAETWRRLCIQWLPCSKDRGLVSMKLGEGCPQDPLDQEQR
jgi:hypothetical protein